MELPKSEAIATKLIWVEETGSTNSDLISAAIKEGALHWPDLSVYVTGFQNAGRGRSGRAWLAPAGSSLFVSVLLRPTAPVETFGWLPLLAGVAMARATSGRLPSSSGKVGVKWPNDVLVGGQKISGVLSELVPDLSGVVIGAGLNLTLSREQLPVETATSLALVGDAALADFIGKAAPASELDQILCSYLVKLRSLTEEFSRHNGDAVASGLQAMVAAECVTLGQQVRAILPGDQELWGEAKSIDAQGRLVIEKPNGQIVTVSAGDIVHLRLQ